MRSGGGETDRSGGGGSPALERLISPLTARESDVIRLMLDGYSNKEIADRLTLSIATIKVHRRHIYAKLNVKSHSEIFALLINPPAPRLADAR